MEEFKDPLLKPYFEDTGVHPCGGMVQKFVSSDGKCEAIVCMYCGDIRLRSTETKEHIESNWSDPRQLWKKEHQEKCEHQVGFKPSCPICNKSKEYKEITNKCPICSEEIRIKIEISNDGKSMLFRHFIQGYWYCDKCKSGHSFSSSCITENYKED